MSKISFPQLEEEILAFWEKEKIFEKSLNKKSPQGEYVFYDGPPFATGRPHYGHIVASLMKDMVPRYQTMRGYHVERRWGWDCHGLPIENIVEQELQLKHKGDIINYGIDRFNAACRSKVLTYASDWRQTIRRLGRWVDMDNDYKTMDTAYMESEWWVFKQLWEQGLIYKDYKSMHICPRCETTLAQAEVTEGYQDVEDVSVTVKFRIAGRSDLYILAWTTTPWTLIGNVALAVGCDIKYVQIKQADGHNYILAADRLPSVTGEYEIVERYDGSDLAGWKYEPLFPYYQNFGLKNKENGWQVYCGDFVTTQEGTGVVHIAPAFGEDDMIFGKTNNLPFIQHVTMSGIIKDEVSDFAGREVKPKDNIHATDDEIIKWLKEKNLVFSSEKYQHSYPHCWRCDTPLLNYAADSWFVAVTKVKDKLLQTAAPINWVPAYVKAGRFGNWLEGARDWSISRERFWGTPLPVWRCQAGKSQNSKGKSQNVGCGNFKVIGSRKELEKYAINKIPKDLDLHRPFIDEIKIRCDKCGGEMSREIAVLDCWFESGSMPYAQEHYPFANKHKFEKNFPAAFIAEGADQVSKWFYYLHVLATILRGSAAFKNVIVNGIVLATDGKKMSKRLKNYPEPDKIFTNHGADALRYYLATSPVMRIEDLRFSEAEVGEVVKKFLLVLMNVLSFYEMYAVGRQIPDQPKSEHILDRWIMIKLADLTKKVTAGYESYDLNKATRPLADFVNELSTWYVRRSRDRFKSSGKEKEQVVAVLGYVLQEFSKLMAPVMPFIADYVYQKVNPAELSVHLSDWPIVRQLGEEEQGILNQMQAARELVEQALALRAAAGLKIRQPLLALEVTETKLNEELQKIIKEEINVKEIKLGQAELKLDTNITAELKLEGILRELSRQINALRKQAGLTINDLIKIAVLTDSKPVKEMLAKHREELFQLTLAKELSDRTYGSNIVKQIKIEAEDVKIEIEKI